MSLPTTWQILNPALSQEPKKATEQEKERAKKRLAEIQMSVPKWYEKPEVNMEVITLKDIIGS